MGPIIDFFVSLFRIFYQQLCRIQIAIWRCWRWFKALTYERIWPLPDSVIEFRPPWLDLSEVPPEKFFRLRAIHEEMHRMVAEALGFRAEALRITVDGNGVGLQFFVDGVSRSENFELRVDRQKGCDMMDLFRGYARLHGHDFTPRQHGDFEVTFEGIEFDCRLQISFTSTGDRELILWFSERRVMPLDVVEKDPVELFRKLGMRPEIFDALKGLLSEGSGVRPGIVLISAPPQNGFNTTFNGVIKLIDPYLNRPVALERVDDAQKNEWRIGRNVVDIFPYDSRNGQKPINLLLEVLENKMPKVVCIRRLPEDEEDAAVMDELCHQREKNRLVLAGVEATDALEALIKGRDLALHFDKYFDAITGVLNQRLVRKLCENCKEQYSASPQLLEELKLPAGHSAFFWKPGLPGARPGESYEDRPKVCPNCNGAGYDGRTAVFQLLVIDDRTRDAVRTIGRLQLPKPLDEDRKIVIGENALNPEEYKEEMQKIILRTGHASLIQEGIFAAATGVTSIEELQRVGILENASNS